MSDAQSGLLVAMQALQSAVSGKKAQLSSALELEQSAWEAVSDLSEGTQSMTAMQRQVCPHNLKFLRFLTAAKSSRSCQDPADASRVV